MTDTFTKISPDDLTGFTQHDEGALERIFRDEYDALATLAASESTEPATAPRLVEAAFFDAWRQSDRFRSPGDLEFFLRDAIHKEAVRENGRRAAMHRFQAHEGAAATQHHAPPRNPASVDEAWEDFSAVLHAPPPDAAHAAHVRADQSRHGAAAHVKGIGTERAAPGGSMLMIAVAAVVLIAIVFAVRTFGGHDPNARADDALAAEGARVVDTRPGLRANVDLADGSRAALGPDTHLRIAKSFSRGQRALALDGTATFTVATVDGPPFSVRAGRARVTATGTVFDVSAYADRPIVVRVREGSVRVTSGDSVRLLDAGGTLSIGADGGIATPPDAIVEESLAWTDGRFAMLDRPMSELPALLQRWYGMQVQVGDSTLLARRLTLRASLDSSRTLVEQIEAQAEARYAQRGDVRMFRDARPVPR